MSKSSSQGSDKSLSFDDISNCFSLPIAEAAHALGVCTSVLKKICRENGIERWPYRKFQSGTSVEEIKKLAVRERSKELSQLLKVNVQGNDALTTSSVSATIGSQPQKDISSPWEMSKLHGATPPHTLHQQGSRNIQNGRPQNLPNAGLSKVIAATLDEFKYGFPTSGLSMASNKWWGSSSPDGYEGSNGDRVEIDDEDDKKQTKPSADDGAILLATNEDKAEKEEGIIGSQGTGLLTSVRKATVEEGRKILKLGVCKDHGMLKTGKREKRLLLQIFGSSLPSEWINGSS